MAMSFYRDLLREVYFLVYTFVTKRCFVLGGAFPCFEFSKVKLMGKKEKKNVDNFIYKAGKRLLITALNLIPRLFTYTRWVRG